MSDDKMIETLRLFPRDPHGPVADAIGRAMLGCEVRWLSPEQARRVQAAAANAIAALDLSALVARIRAEAQEEERVTARDTAREALIELIRDVLDTCTCTPYPVGEGPEIDCPMHGRADYQGEHVADRLLASPALDAVVAERVAALAEDEALIARLYRESRGSRSLGDIRMVLRALAAALTERGVRPMSEITHDEQTLTKVYEGLPAAPTVEGDRAPCPTCGGDRLRGDFTAPGSGRCHVGGTTADCRAAAPTVEGDRPKPRTGDMHPTETAGWSLPNAASTGEGDRG